MNWVRKIFRKETGYTIIKIDGYKTVKNAKLKNRKSKRVNPDPLKSVFNTTN